MIQVHQIQAHEWPTYRDLRLRALRDSPDMFGSTYAAEKNRPDAAWQAQIANAVSKGLDRALFATYRQQVCGLIWCKLMPADSSTAHLYQMWVDPAMRGLGAGHALLDAAVTWAKTMSAQRVRLGVTDRDSPAMRLYGRYGFRPIGEAEPLREGSPINARTLELVLNTDRTACAP